ncbi:MAG: leucine-rich repeat domain-containing protein, partial [Ureaplasma sp.]|nr:leucine-rich repeat domain-containing protein [Ureaplasma sp.]
NDGPSSTSKRVPIFQNTAIKEMKIVSDNNNVSVTDGQLLLPNTITMLATNCLANTASLTKVDLSAATNLTTINANAFAQSPITELTLPTSTTVNIGGVDIVQSPASQLAINGVIGNNTQFAADYFASTPVVRAIANWGNVASNTAAYTNNTSSIINDAQIRTIDFSQVGVPTGNTTSAAANGIAANTLANIYFGSYFPANASNWSDVALSGEFSGNAALTNGIFDTVMFDSYLKNWNSLSFGHQVYENAGSGASVSAANLANLMNNFGGVIVDANKNLIANGATWTAPTSAVGSNTGTGAGQLDKDLTSTDVITGWTTSGSNKTKSHNGITWTYTAGDSTNGTLAYIEADVASVKVYNSSGNQVRYFSSNPLSNILNSDNNKRLLFSFC